MSRPIWHALLRRIEERGGAEPIWDRIASGESIASIAASYETSRRHLNMWLLKPERKIQYYAARLRRPAAAALSPVAQAVLRMGGEDAILEQIASGVTLTKIAKEGNASYQNLLLWFQRQPARHEKYKQARVRSAGALADQAMDVVDDADISKPETANAAIRKAEKQAEIRKWRAGLANRAEYGNQEAGNLNVTIGALHLNALRKLGGPQPMPILEGEVISVETIQKES